MKIFITGINGFIGSSLANYFCSRGYSISGCGRRSSLGDHLSSQCEYFKIDITKSVPDIQADIVIHTAGLTDDKLDFKTLYETNVTGTANVLDACKQIKQLIYISSSSVYSFHKDIPYLETDVSEDLELLSPYGQTKLLGERIVYEANHIPSRLILRPRAVYGLGDTVLLPRLLKLVKADLLILPAHISQKISLTNIGNIIEVLQIFIERDTPGINVYNICDEEIYALDKAILALVNAVRKQKTGTLYIPKQLWSLLITANSFLKFNTTITKFASRQMTNTALLSTSKIQKDLGFKSSKSLYQEAQKIGEWYREEILKIPCP